MPQVSKYPISKGVYARCWEIFAKTLINIKSSSDAELIVNDLLTPIERIMVSKRLAIAMLLKRGCEYQQIKEVLRVSSPTIAMVNNTLRFGSNGYNKAIENILLDENLKEFFNKTLQTLISPATKGKGGGTWRYLKKELEMKSKDKKPF